MTAVFTAPAPTEFDPYFGTYISKVNTGDALALLRIQLEETLDTLSKVSEKDSLYRYAPGKWSLREMLAHISDTERIFTYRALCFARGEKQGLPGFDENDYVSNASFDSRPWADHLAEFRSVRAATIAFFAGLNAEELMRSGTSSGGKKFTVRAIAYIIAGHEKHHMGVVREKYLRK